MINKTRGGFTLIELVIAIVVMAIALMSVPLLLSQTSKSDEFSINQEAILAGATKAGNLLTYPWDDKLVGQLTVKYILDVSNGDNELDRSAADPNRRIGNFKANYRRKFNTDETNASLTFGRANDANTTAYNDIDDFNDTTESITNGGVGDYLKDFNLATTVSYISDNAVYSSSPTLNINFNTASVAPSTNIKLVEVQVINTANNEPITTLRAFSTNIGSYELIYRTFP